MHICKFLDTHTQINEVYATFHREQRRKQATHQLSLLLTIL